jgi:hypothetical protein
MTTTRCGLAGGGRRIGELAVPCDPKSATRGDPLTRGRGSSEPQYAFKVNDETLPRRASVGEDPSEGKDSSLHCRNR